MSFASGYLARQAIRDRLIDSPPDPGVGIIVTIPACNEEGLILSLDSLLKCTAPPVKTEVLIFFNAPEGAEREVIENNRIMFERTKQWQRENSLPWLQFHVLFEEVVREKEAGAGLVRKILMDEAIRRFDVIERLNGIIISLDADTLVDANYFTGIYEHFLANRDKEGCSLLFEHPLSGPGFKDDVYRAITSYELHLRYYLQAVRYTGYPFAFHTIGSAFAVLASAYVAQGGMNRRQGGEDFYFIQKLAKTGRFSECRTATVFPSPRPSDRVPFGTGPVVKRLTEGRDIIYFTSSFEAFRALRSYFMRLQDLYEGKSAETLPVLSSYLEESCFNSKLDEIRSNTGSRKSFEKRFFQYFDMLEILKYLHFARENGFPDSPVAFESPKLLKAVYGLDLYGEKEDVLLEYFRKIDRGFTYL